MITLPARPTIIPMAPESPNLLLLTRKSQAHPHLRALNRRRRLCRKARWLMA